MLAICDRDGVVEASVPGLAREALVSRVECEQALAILSAPDPDSRTPDHEGRRIEKVDGGWRLLNHGKYREKMDAEEIRAKAAERQRRSRERKRQRDGHCDITEVTTVTANNDMQKQQQIPSAHAEASSEQQAAVYRDFAGTRPPRAAAPRAESAAPSPAHRALVAGYRRRMDERGKVWVTIPTAHIEACAAAVQAQAKVTGATIDDVADAWLTRAFADAEMLARVKADVPPWGVLAKRPEQWLPDGKALDPATAERARLTELVLEGHILTDAERAVMGLPPKGATAERAPLSKVLANCGGRGRIPT